MFSRLLLAWLRERFKYQEAQANYVKLLEKPDIKLRIEHLQVSRSQLDETKSFVVLMASLQNEGTQTSIDEWMLMVYPVNGEALRARLLGAPDELIIPGQTVPGRSTVLLAKDALYTKAILPIIKGQRIRGHMWFEVDAQKDILARPGTRFVLSCANITGERHPSELTFQDYQGPTLGDIGFPGSEMRVIQEMPKDSPSTAKPQKRPNRKRKRR